MILPMIYCISLHKKSSITTPPATVWHLNECIWIHSGISCIFIWEFSWASPLIEERSFCFTSNRAELGLWNLSFKNIFSITTETKISRFFLCWSWIIIYSPCWIKNISILICNRIIIRDSQISEFIIPCPWTPNSLIIPRRFTSYAIHTTWSSVSNIYRRINYCFWCIYRIGIIT